MKTDQSSWKRPGRCREYGLQSKPIMRKTFPASESLPSGTKCTTWMHSQIDVYDLIAKHQASVGPSLSNPYSLADVGQSAGRGSVRLDGTAPTLRTSTNLFDFQESKFVDPRAHFALHGHDVTKLTFEGLSDSAIRRLAGNGMSCSTMAVALTPILAKLGYLERVP